MGAEWASLGSMGLNGLNGGPRQQKVPPIMGFHTEPLWLDAVNLVCAFPALLASGKQESAVSGLSLPAEIQ